MFFLEEESVVNGSFSKIQRWVRFFVLFLIQPSRPTALCSGPAEVGDWTRSAPLEPETLRVAEKLAHVSVTVPPKQTKAHLRSP